ncbi:HAMP domain-containing histidine kinase [Sphingobacterium sp. lm-10]|uniref:sensor histidine kinase n=1 Tax=Sphingobacterium sp. lm-10 TaxID=2944904 RepID=UPI002021484A|nr:HAMP domain-containing sensor histidine kinase [Sphingobacterium sp. lm-10]MCL7988084.1 HAMP domain-containing histidine kinase [Sphingobacterium sp. lm-10]
MGNLQFKEFVRALLLMGLCSAAGYLFFAQALSYAIIAAILALILVFQWFNRHIWLQKQIDEFSEAVKYRDFTRRYAVKKTRNIENQLYASFNRINEAFKDVSAKREIQHQYLTKVINMLDSALIFYHADSGKVEWINSAFKEMFETPHLGNIRGLKKRRTELYEKTMQLKIGQQHIETAHSSKGRIKLLIQVSEFETEDGLYRIVMYQNVNDAMDETENRAWHKLLRVLTHEIMNSIAPISSIAETLHGRLEQTAYSDELEDVKVGVHTIKKRSEGLLKFAKSYRLINKVDKPKFTEIAVVQLFENIYNLLEPSFLQKGVDVDIILKNTRAVIQADLHLIEQVVINLMLNAMEAVKDAENPYISMSALEENGRVQLKISDNGEGMEAEIQEQIFTPFFTTKKTGSGIGLTLSKQIMLVHNGNIFVYSELGKGSTFTLQF